MGTIRWQWLSVLVVVSWAMPLAAQDTAVTSPVALEGTWYGGPVDELELSARGVVTGNSMVFTELQNPAAPAESFTFTPSAVSGNHLTVTATSAGITGDVHVLFRSENEAFLWVEMESELVRLRRGGEVPEALLGDWEVDSTRPRVGDPTMQMSVTDSQLTLVENGNARIYAVHPLAPASTATELVLVRDGGELVTLVFEPLEDGVYVLHVSSEDDGMIAFRPGMRPAWLTASPR